MFCLSPIKKCKKEYARLLKRKHEILSTNETLANSKEFDYIDNQINELIEGKYSEEVFRYYSKKKPVLIRIHTGEEISWADAFGDSFESVSKSLRHSLVGIIEGGGKYRLQK